MEAQIWAQCLLIIIWAYWLISGETLKNLDRLEQIIEGSHRRLYQTVSWYSFAVAKRKASCKGGKGETSEISAGLICSASMGGTHAWQEPHRQPTVLVASLSSMRLEIPVTTDSFSTHLSPQPPKFNPPCPSHSVSLLKPTCPNISAIKELHSPQVLFLYLKLTEDEFDSVFVQHQALCSLSSYIVFGWPWRSWALLLPTIGTQWGTFHHRHLNSEEVIHADLSGRHFRKECGELKVLRERSV